jgi:DNA-binding transcriptional LysR family regulator
MDRTMATFLDPDQLRTFLAIAETGSFTRAGEEVHKTQSAVSMQIKRLEERLARQLFERGGRIVRLTPDGRRLMDYAQRMIRLNAETVAAFTEPALSGEVRLGLPDDYAERLLPRVLSAFARTHPHVELIVNCHSSAALVNHVSAGKLDMAIVTHGDCGIMGEVVRREPLHWVTSMEHTVHLADPLLLATGPHSCSWRAAAQQALDGVKKNYKIAYTSSSAAALSSAVNAGLAVAVLPESAVRAEMRVLTSADGFPSLPHCDIALLRSERARSPIHEVLASHIVTRIGNLPYRRMEAAE